MKLHSPAFEKRLRRRVIDVVNENFASREKWRNARKPSWGKRLTPFVRVFPLLMIWAIISGARELQAGIDLQIAVVTMWFTGLSLLGATLIFSQIHGSTGERPALENLPIADETIFDWHWHGICLAARWRIFDALILGLAIAQNHSLTSVHYVALATFSLLQWRVSHTLNAVFSAHTPLWLCALLGLVFCSTPILLAAGRGALPEHLTSPLQQMASWVNLLFPAGWLAAGLERFVNPVGDVNWLFLAPIALILTQLKPAQSVLRKQVVYTELTFPTSPGRKSDDIDEMENGYLPALANDSLTNSGDRALGETEITDAISQREFLAPIPFEQDFGFVERRTLKWLKPRERLLLEAFGGFPLGFTKSWIRCWKFMTVAMLIGLLFPPAKGWPIFYHLITGLITVGMLCEAGIVTVRAFSGNPNGATLLVYYSGFPVGYRELGMLGIKAGLTRALFAIPLLLIYGAYLGWTFDAAWLVSDTIQITPLRAALFGAETGLELALIVMSATPLLVAFQFSSKSLDTNRSTLRALVLVIFAILPAPLIALGIIFAIGLTSHVLVTVPGILILSALGWFQFWLYGRMHNANRFDLILPQNQSGIS